jgi:hypothetical protein
MRNHYHRSTCFRFFVLTTYWPLIVRDLLITIDASSLALLFSLIFAAVVVLARGGPLPDSGRERPLLLSKPEQSRMRAQSRRRRSPYHKAMPATREAWRHLLEGASQPASARTPHDRTSKAAFQPSIRRSYGCSGPHRPPPSRYATCPRMLGTKDLVLLGPMGGCLVALYNAIPGAHIMLGEADGSVAQRHDRPARRLRLWT